MIKISFYQELLHTLEEDLRLKLPKSLDLKRLKIRPNGRIVYYQHEKSLCLL